MYVQYNRACSGWIEQVPAPPQIGSADEGSSAWPLGVAGAVRGSRVAALGR